MGTWHDGVFYPDSSDEFLEFPKELRDDLGLSAGTVLTIEEKSGGILLKPVGSRAGLVRKEGVLVFAGSRISSPASVSGAPGNG